MGSATKIGTTSRGIGPTYSDKVNRHAGIRVGDLLEFDHFQKKLDYNLETKAEALQIGGPRSTRPARNLLRLRTADRALCDRYGCLHARGTRR